MATFWEIAAARLAICSHCILSICNICLFPVFGFKSGICLLIAPVPVHSFSITFTYTKFEPNIACGSRFMSIFTKRARPAELMILGEASPPFFIAVRLDNVKVHQYAKFDPNATCGSRVTGIYTKRARLAKMMLGEACHRLHTSGWTKIKIHKYTKFEPNIPCGLISRSIFTKRA